LPRERGHTSNGLHREKSRSSTGQTFRGKIDRDVTLVLTDAVNEAETAT
jgi:hypothetical protein